MSIFPYDVDFVYGARIGELARRSVGKNSDTVRFLPYKSLLLCFGFQGTPQSLSLLIVWYFFKESTKFGASSNHLLWKSWTCVSKGGVSAPLVSIRQTTKSSIWPFSIFNQSVWNLKISRIPKQQDGLGITLEFLHRYRPTWYKNPFFSAILIFVTWYHLSLMLRRTWLRKVKLKWEWTSFKLKQLWKVELCFS